ncbi:MAG: DinB family protein [Chloroflexota bacterium]
MPEYTPQLANNFVDMLRETDQRLQKRGTLISNERANVSANSAWSLHDLLSHIRACQDVWACTIYQLLASENPTLPKIHPDDWQAMIRYHSQPFQQSLSAFHHARLDLLNMLQNLDDTEWQRTGIAGGRPITVFGQVRRMALHEKNSHWEQIVALTEIPD